MPAGLSDDQVASELTKMVAFIKKEAEEKAKEIRIKANEEYEIEKGELVRAAMAAVDKEYALKYKQASMQQQITKSTKANQTRLNVLSAKAGILDEVFQEAEAELKKLSQDPAKYEPLLVELIVESVKLLKNEDSVVVTVREADAEVAGRAAKTAAEKTESQIELDTKKSLDPESAGGVFVSSGNGKIVVDNTFEERLKILGVKALPLLRLDLFGFSRTRRFFD